MDDQLDSDQKQAPITTALVNERNRPASQVTKLVFGCFCLIILGLVAAGTYSWQQSKINRLNSKISSLQKLIQKDNATSSGLINYSNPAENFSVTYPAYLIRGNTKACSNDPNDQPLLLGTDSLSAGSCGNEGTPEILFSSTKGDVRAGSDLLNGFTNLPNKGFNDFTKTSITVNGVIGSREQAVAEGQGMNEGLGALPDGTIAILYLFYTNNRTYTAAYYRLPTYKDIQSDFDNMILYSLKFSS